MGDFDFLGGVFEVDVVGQAVGLGVEDALVFGEVLVHWCDFPDVFHVLMYKNIGSVKK